MRTIFGLLGVVAIAVLAVLGYQWWTGSSSPVTITYPTEGATLAGNTVPVRLNVKSDLQNQLNAPGSQTQIVTYLDDKEVARGKDTSYNLTSVAPGQHKLSLGLVDTNGNSTGNGGLNLTVLPRPVNFTLGGGLGANQNVPGSNANIYSNDPNAVPTPTAVVDLVPAAPTPTPQPVNVPAAPTPIPTAAPALPATGMGGMSKSLNSSASSVKQAEVIDGQSAALSRPQQVALDDGSHSQLVVSNAQVNSDAVIAADRASQNEPQDPLSVIMRGMWAFYLAGFIVVLGAIVFIQRRRS